MRDLLNTSSSNATSDPQMDKLLKQINGIDQKIETLTEEIVRLRACSDD